MSDEQTVVHVVPHDDGWHISIWRRLEGPHKVLIRELKAERASGVFDLKRDAVKRARELAGRGAVYLHRRNGKIRRLPPVA